MKPYAETLAHLKPCDCDGAACLLACNPVSLENGHYCRMARPSKYINDLMVALVEMRSALRDIQRPFPVTQTHADRLVEIVRIAHRALDKIEGLPI